MAEFKKTPSVVSSDPPESSHSMKQVFDFINCAWCPCVLIWVTFLGFIGEFVAHHVYGDESQQHRGEGDKEAQILGDRLLDVSNAQEHNHGIQIHQPVEPERNKSNKQQKGKKSFKYFTYCK